LQTLIELEAAVKSMPTAPKPNLLPLFARLDELARACPRHRTRPVALSAPEKLRKSAAMAGRSGSLNVESFPDDAAPRFKI
jgi:hypothetical protein